MANAERDVIFLGDRSNKKQGIVSIPAKTTANMPGVLNLQSVSGTTVTDRKLFITSAGTDLRVTTGTTFADTDGSSLSSAGANVTLSNLSGTVAIPITIASDTANTDDLGTDPKSWRTLYWTTSLKKIGTTYDVTLAATEPSAASYTYTFPDAGAAANVMLDTGAATAITYTKSTANITLGAAATFDIAAAGNVDFGTGIYNFVGAIDIATGKSVDINMDVTIGGGAFVTSAACTLDQDLPMAASPTFVGLTLSGAIGGATTGGFSGIVTATGGLAVNADNAKLGLGTDGVSDSYIAYNGSNLVLWDTTGGPYTLQQLATGTTLNPYVNGDLTLADGNFIWGNTSAAETATWTLAATTVDGIDIVSSNTTANAVHITANATAAGSILNLTSVDATMTSGAYIYCYDGGAQDFAVRRYGATTIAGVASTDVLTLTAGDVKVTAGDIRLSLGLISVDNTGDELNYFYRNHATSTKAVVEIEQTNAADAALGPCLLIDQNSIGNSIGIQIVHNGDYAAIDIAADAARVGNAINIATANFLTSRALYVSGASTGTNGQGIIEVAVTGALAGNLLRLTQGTGAPATTSAVAYLSSTGAIAGAIDGIVLQVLETGAASGTSYAVNINSTSNEALHVTVGKSLFSEAVTIATADTINQDTLTVTQLDATNNKDGIVCAVTGTGYVFKGTVNSTTGKGFDLIAADGQTTTLFTIDGTTGATAWVGAANSTPMVYVNCDGALANAATSLVAIASSGTAAAANTNGICLRLAESGADSAGSYTMGIISTHNDGLDITCTDATRNALNIVTGIADLNGTVKLSGIQVLDGTPDECAAANSAVSITTAITHLDTTIGACANMTLANGAEGQMKYIVMTVFGGNATITPTSLLGAINTIAFTAVGQSCTLLYTSAGWTVIGYYGVTLA